MVVRRTCIRSVKIILSAEHIFVIKHYRWYRCLAGHMAMHACQIGPIDTAPSCPGSPLRVCVGTKGGIITGIKVIQLKKLEQLAGWNFRMLQYQ